jgi:hypothetical protein
MSVRSPFITANERSRPSRVKPARSATRSEATLPGSVWSWMRASARASNAQAQSSPTARAATPRPRAGAATQ